MKSQMLRAFSVLLFVVLNTSVLLSQPMTFAQAVAPVPFLPGSTVLPVSGSTINYTQIMFDHPPVAKAHEYEIVYVERTAENNEEGQTVRDSSCSTLIGGFHFGSSCKWYYRALNAKGKEIFKSPQYEFSIASLPAGNRVRVVTNSNTSHMGGYISFDYHCMITDRDGNPVWILPVEPKNEYSREDRVRDIRVTSAGTFTFITNRNAFEIMPDGRISWRGPKSGANSVGALHHQIERLPNGNLLTLGNHTVPLPVPFDTAVVPVEFGVIVEFDRAGRIIWKWDSYSYLRPAEIQFRKETNGRWTSSSHMNAFRQTTENGTVYVYAGFRDLDRLIKIDKSTGKVVGTYGTQMNSGYGWYYNDLFHAQHDVCPLKDGNIAVFNNDSVSRDGVVSSLVIFAPGSAGEKAKLVYRFACDVKGITNGKSEKCGGVDELPNGNLLVNCGNVNRTFEIMRNGTIVWEAYTESRATDTSSWLAAGQYRSHYIPTLYPVWFSSAIVSSGKKMVTMKIWNDGGNEDKYTIQYLVGNTWVTLSTVEVAVNKSTTAMIPRVNGLVFSKIKVVSGANPDFFRIMDVNQ